MAAEVDDQWTALQQALGQAKERLDSPEDVQQITKGFFTAVVNYLKASMTGDLGRSFVQMPWLMLTTGDQAVGLGTMLAAKDEVDKQLTKFKTYFDERFDDAKKSLKKDLGGSAKKVKEASTMAAKTADDLTALQQVSNKFATVVEGKFKELEAKELDRELKMEAGFTKMTKWRSIEFDLVLNTWTGDEKKIGDIRSAIYYAVGLVDDELEWKGKTALEGFLASRKERLTRKQVWSFVAPLVTSEEAQKLQKNLVAMKGSDLNPGKEFLFETWQAHSVSRSNKKQEKLSVESKKAKKVASGHSKPKKGIKSRDDSGERDRKKVEKVSTEAYEQSKKPTRSRKKTKPNTPAAKSLWDMCCSEIDPIAEEVSRKRKRVDTDEKLEEALSEVSDDSGDSRASDDSHSEESDD